MSDNQVRTALISVTDKTGLVSFANVLKERSVRILSSSGTMRHLVEGGVEAEEIAEYTGSREILGGRVKTLHPRIHAGILADRDNKEHMAELEKQEIAPIDLVVVNLYPFRERYRGADLSDDEMCEFIDIGGITLIRAAAKNSKHVTVVTHPDQYDEVAAEIGSTGTVSETTRVRLARDAFSLTCSYDGAIESFFRSLSPAGDRPARINIVLEKIGDLRYGENPHQSAALYRSDEESALLAMEQKQGKALSYNNYLDIIGAFALARDTGEGSVAIIKHTNPCGAGWCGDVLRSYRRALQADSKSAFGGIVAVNGEVDGELANEMNQIFLEVVLARNFDSEALAVLAKKKNLRVVSVPDAYWEETGMGHMVYAVEGIALRQDRDAGFPELSTAKVVTARAPSDKERLALEMGWKVAKHVKSNAVLIADEEGTVGIGAGQMSRVDASQIATRKAFDADFSLIGKVAASDAFFPFADGITALATAGITAVIQPGGSIRDQEVIDAADAANVAMLFTGRRHFRHL